MIHSDLKIEPSLCDKGEYVHYISIKRLRLLFWCHRIYDYSLLVLSKYCAAIPTLTVISNVYGGDNLKLTGLSNSDGADAFTKARQIVLVVVVCLSAWVCFSACSYVRVQLYCRSESKSSVLTSRIWFIKCLITISSVFHECVRLYDSELPILWLKYVKWYSKL